jgi:hypothetical protein
VLFHFVAGCTRDKGEYNSSMETLKRVGYFCVNVGWIFFTYVAFEDWLWYRKKKDRQ